MAGRPDGGDDSRPRRNDRVGDVGADDPGAPPVARVRPRRDARSASRRGHRSTGAQPTAARVARCADRCRPRARVVGPAFQAAGTHLEVGPVLLVDDVVTTGATLRAAAGALRSMGATTVVAVWRPGLRDGSTGLDGGPMVGRRAWEAVMGWDHVTDSPSARADRLAGLRAAIAAGTYAPEPTAVAESLVAWIAEPRTIRPNRSRFSSV